MPAQKETAMSARRPSKILWQSVPPHLAQSSLCPPAAFACWQVLADAGTMARVAAAWQEPDAAVRAAANMGVMAQRNFRQLSKRRTTASGRNTGSMRGLQQQALPRQPTGSAEVSAGVLAPHRTSSSVISQESQLHAAEAEAASLTLTGRVSSSPIHLVPLAIESYALGKFSFKVRQPGAMLVWIRTCSTCSVQRGPAKHPLIQKSGSWCRRVSQRCARSAR